MLIQAINSLILLTTAISESPIPASDDVNSIFCFTGIILGIFYIISFFAYLADNKRLPSLAWIVMLIGLLVFFCFSAVLPSWSKVYLSKDGQHSITEKVKEWVYNNTYGSIDDGLFEFKNTEYYTEPIYSMHAPDTKGFHTSPKIFHPGCLLYYPVLVLAFWMLVCLLFIEFVKGIVDLFR